MDHRSHLRLIAAPRRTVQSSYQYTAELEHTGENYFVPIGVCHFLKPGEADRFTIRLACSQSAFHEFRIRWEFAGGLFSYSYPIMLEQVVPRTFASEELAYAMQSELEPCPLGAVDPPRLQEARRANRFSS
jgi:hypothetical protein